MRELYLVESLVQIIYSPFKCEYDFQNIKTTDVIARFCQKVYVLIKNIAAGYYQNELYVGQWINLYFTHSMATNNDSYIGAEDTIISLVDNNKKILEIQVTPSIIGKFVQLCIDQKREKKLI